MIRMNQVLLKKHHSSRSKSDHFPFVSCLTEMTDVPSKMKMKNEKVSGPFFMFFPARSFSGAQDQASRGGA